MGVFNLVNCQDIFVQDSQLDLQSKPCIITWVKIVLCIISLWLFSTLSWRGKAKEWSRKKEGGKKLVVSFIKNLIFMSLWFRSWRMFPVPETMQFHLQEQWGELPVLVSEGICPAGGWENVQRWGKSFWHLWPLSMSLLSDSNLTNWDLCHMQLLQSHFLSDHFITHRKF